MPLPAFLTRRKETTVPDTTVPTTPAETPDRDVLMRFVTKGGAPVEVYPTRFVTRWLTGPPTLAFEPYEIDGFQWKCRGCDAYGREGDDYHDPNYREKSEARNAANEHAEKCRALPKPTA